MKTKREEKKCSMLKITWLFLIFGSLFFLAKTDLGFAAPIQTELASGLQAGVGVALDQAKNQLYFVEYKPDSPDKNGKLKRINLPPLCTDAACAATIEVIASGFSHPEDVQLDLDHGFAYVTTRDDDGTTGVLWKVNLATYVKTKVTFNLGAPQQLVLDVANNQAFVVGYDDGRLRRIDLTTGAKTPVFIGLGHPVGLAVTKNRRYAYVTEQTGGKISKIDLTLGTKDPIPLATGLTAPFSLAWADDTQNALYVVKRDPANRISRVDLITHTKRTIVTGLPVRPSGIAVSGNGTLMYIATDSKLVMVDITNMSDLLKEPIFVAVGHVPSTMINDAGYTKDIIERFFPLTWEKHLPFGGTLDIFGNLNKFKELQAKYYQVLVSGNPLNLSWNTYKWNPEQGEYELVPVAPDPTAPNAATSPKYKIPDEYPLNAAWWVPSFLMMRWPSGNNGLYTFTVKIFDAAGEDITDHFHSDWKNSLTVNIDNTPPDVKILSIWQKGTLEVSTDPCYPDKEIKPCDIVSSCQNKYYFKITANDPNSHLLYYQLTVMWGDNKSESPQYSWDTYANHIPTSTPPTPPYPWSGVANYDVPRVSPGSPETPGTKKSWSADCNCAHTFYLGAWKRTIDGYNYILYRDYHKSITINNTGQPCL